MNVLMFQCIKVMSSMSYLIKRLPVQIHLGTSQSDTNEQWANSNVSLHGDDNGLVFSKQCPPLNNGVKRCFNTFKKKRCFHPTEMVSLNDVGQYVIFPATLTSGQIQPTIPHNCFAQLHVILRVGQIGHGWITRKWKLMHSLCSMCVSFQKM